MAKSRTIRANLVRSLQHSSRPIYVVDDHRRIIYGNASAVSWTGLDEEDFTSLACQYHSEADESLANRVAAALCPPPQTFSGEPQTAMLQFVDDLGNPRRRNANFFPLFQDEEGWHVLAIVAPQEAADSETASHDPHRELARLRETWHRQFNLDRFVGKSPIAKRIRRQAIAAARAAAPTLVIGPGGSGRQSLCRAIHHASASSDQPEELQPPLVPLDCSVCDAEMIQAALKDLHHLAESSAHPNQGRFLLLEADRLPQSAQHELAGFFELPNFQFGVLATANQPLEPLVAEAQFDRGLASYLSTLVIELPPLAERTDDIPLLAQMFLESFNARGGVQLSGFEPAAMEALLQYRWPGNLNELAQLVLESCQNCESHLVSVDALPKQIRMAREAERFERPAESKLKLDDFLHDVESELVSRALAQTKGNKSKAAQLLGVSRQRIIRWAERLENEDQSIQSDES